MSNISAADLSGAIEKILNDFSDHAIKAVDAASVSTGRKVVRFLKQASPSDHGDYAKGWTMKRVEKRYGNLTVVVYNGKHYRLTHLLEHGHAKINGGRTKAQPHIKPAEEMAQQEFLQDIKLEVGKNK